MLTLAIIKPDAVAARHTGKIIAHLEAAIEFAEDDVALAPSTIPNDTYYSYEWHLPKIDAPSAWDLTSGSGSVIIAIVNSELTVKRLAKRQGKLMLVPENQQYPPLAITETTAFEVWGVVTYVIHRV